MGEGEVGGGEGVVLLSERLIIEGLLRFKKWLGNIWKGVCD